MIGWVCPLVLATLVAAGPSSIATLATVQPLTPCEAPSQSGQWAWGATDGIPFSLSIRNDGDQDGRLLGAATPVAQCARLHRTRLVRGQPAAVTVPGGLVVPAGATITLEPGSGRLVLFGLRADLVQGDLFPLTLRFDRAGEVTVVARVRRRVDAAPKLADATRVGGRPHHRARFGPAGCGDATT